MKQSVLETLVGAIVIGIAGYFLYFAIHSQERHKGSGYELLAQFSDVEGLSPGSPVRISGVKVGTVSKITLDPKTYQATVHLQLASEFKVPSDTLATVTFPGLLGDKYMSLTPGNADDLLKGGDTISDTQSAASLETLLGQVIFSLQNVGKNTSSGTTQAPDFASGSGAPVTLSTIRQYPVTNWNASDYAAHGSFVSDLGRPVLSLLDVKPGMRVLDLGCGDGTLSVELQKMGASVIGVDSSPDMVASAVALGVDARVADGQHLTFANEFDAVFSNAALHWMATDPQAVVNGVFRALKPGQFVAEMGGKGNVAHIVEAFTQALHHAGLHPDIDRIWYFPSRADYAAKLEEAGFKVDSIDIFERPTPLPTGIEPWLRLFGRPMLMRLPAHDRDHAVKRIVHTLEPYLRDPQGHWIADYVRLRFVATKLA